MSGLTMTSAVCLLISSLHHFIRFNLTIYAQLVGQEILCVLLVAGGADLEVIGDSMPHLSDNGNRSAFDRFFKG
jgi:hypothetical protein